MRYLKTYKVFENRNGYVDHLSDYLQSFFDENDIAYCSTELIDKFGNGSLIVDHPEGMPDESKYWKYEWTNAGRCGLSIHNLNESDWNNLYFQLNKNKSIIQKYIGSNIQIGKYKDEGNFIDIRILNNSIHEDIDASLEDGRFNPIISDITLDMVDQGFRIEPVYGFDPNESEHYLLIHIHMSVENGYKFNLKDIKPTIMELASQLKGSGAYFNRMETTCTSDKEFKTNAYMSDGIKAGDTNKDISNMLDKHIADVGERQCEYVQLFFIF